MFVFDLTTSNLICVSTNAQVPVPGTVACFNNTISDDGRFVCYAASPNQILTPAIINIFRHDLQTGAEIRITSNAPAFWGVGYNLEAEAFDTTPDGRFVSYLAKTNGGVAVFQWDAQTGASTLVNANPDGSAPVKASCESPRTDATGRYVFFLNDPSYYATNQPASTNHLYCRDMQTGFTRWVDAGTNTSAIPGAAVDYSISADGGAAAFSTTRADLTSQDDNDESDVFVWSNSSNQLESISLADPSLLSSTSGRYQARSGTRISADGRYAVFTAVGQGLVPAATNRFRLVVVRDLLAQTNAVVSLDTNGLNQANGESYDPAISGDGRYVVFSSGSRSNLVTNDNNHFKDIFLYDRQTATTVFAQHEQLWFRLTPTVNAWNPTISHDGRYITFFTNAKNIVPVSGNNITANFTSGRSRVWHHFTR